MVVIEIFRTKRIVGYLACAVCFLCSPIAHAQDADLAKKLSNPIANLISVPFQFNYNDKIGPSESGKQSYVNVQPVIPFSLNAEWNVISRTILPIVDQNDIAPGTGHQFGFGDTLQSLFISPKAPGPGSIIWGVGPAMQFPTATDSLLGSGKYSAGPTGVVLWQTGGWTYGILANHLWSYAGDSNRNNISSTFLQPFVSYTTKDAWTFYGIHLIGLPTNGRFRSTERLPSCLNLAINQCKSVVGFGIGPLVRIMPDPRASAPVFS